MSQNIHGEKYISPCLLSVLVINGFVLCFVFGSCANIVDKVCFPFRRDETAAYL